MGSGIDAENVMPANANMGNVKSVKSVGDGVPLNDRLTIRVPQDEQDSMDAAIEIWSATSGTKDRSPFIRAAIKHFTEVVTCAKGIPMESGSKFFAEFMQATKNNDENGEAWIGDMTRVFNQGGSIDIRFGPDSTGKSGASSVIIEKNQGQDRIL